MQIGDFGILVRSGFSVSKALFFNFLSALLALAGTALVRRLLWLREACVYLYVLHDGNITNLSSIDIQALIWGKDPGHSSWIEVIVPWSSKSTNCILDALVNAHRPVSVLSSRGSLLVVLSTSPLLACWLRWIMAPQLWEIQQSK